MRYMLLIHQGDAPTPRSPEDWATLSEDEQRAVFNDYRAVSATPGVTPGQQLEAPETATTVRVQDGRTLVTDGPFSETAEQVVGFYLVDTDDEDDLRAACTRFASRGEHLELRRLEEDA